MSKNSWQSSKIQKSFEFITIHIICRKANIKKRLFLCMLEIGFEDYKNCQKSKSQQVFERYLLWTGILQKNQKIP